MKKKEINITLKLTEKHYNWLVMMAEKDEITIDDGVSISMIKLLEKNKRKLKDEYKIYSAKKVCGINGV